MTAWTGGTADDNRSSRATNARNLGVAAAKHEYQRAQEAVVAARAAVKISKAELMSVRAERYAGRATLRDTAVAYGRYTNTKRSLRAAVAAAEARRQNIDIARMGVRGNPASLPLAQVTTAHDAITTRWLEYETDAAKIIAFPAMSDVRQPATAAFVRQQRVAQELRPRADARVTVEEFYAYRDAVAALQTAFGVAEHAAWEAAREDAARDTRAAQESRADAARARHVQAREAAAAELKEAQDAAARDREQSGAPEHPSSGPGWLNRGVWPVPGWTRPAPPRDGHLDR